MSEVLSLTLDSSPNPPPPVCNKCGRDYRPDMHFSSLKKDDRGLTVNFFQLGRVVHFESASSFVSTDLLKKACSEDLTIEQLREQICREPLFSALFRSEDWVATYMRFRAHLTTRFRHRFLSKSKSCTAPSYTSISPETPHRWAAPLYTAIFALGLPHEPLAELLLPFTKRSMSIHHYIKENLDSAGSALHTENRRRFAFELKPSPGMSLEIAFSGQMNNATREWLEDFSLQHPSLQFLPNP